MRVLVIGATGYVDPGLTTMIITAARSAAPEAGLVYLSALGASAGGNEYLNVRAAVEFALSSGLNPFTVVRPSFIVRPDRGESRPAERMGAVLLDSVAVLLGLLGNRRRAGNWRRSPALPWPAFWLDWRPSRSMGVCTSWTTFAADGVRAPPHLFFVRSSLRPHALRRCAVRS